eukprot:2187714-Pyramimonas_sp.AAC.1
MQAGLPPPYWMYAVRYFRLCYNARTLEEERSSWERRFGHPFEAPGTASCLQVFCALCASARVEISDRRD